MWRTPHRDLVFTVLFLLVSVMGFVAARWRRADDHGAPRRVGARRPQLRRLGHLVPGRRRPLHGVHVRGRAGADVRGRRHRLLRRAVHRRSSTRWCSWCWSGSGRSRTGTASSRRPTSSAPGSARRPWRCWSRSPASSPRCRTSRCSWSASRRCSRRWASPATLARHLPIIIAFAILAAYTYQSGLRAPALIAFVKDSLIYLVILVAVVYIPYKLGGWGNDLRRGRREVRRSPTPATASCSTPTTNAVRHARVRLGARAVPLPAQRHRRAGQPEPGRRSSATCPRCRRTASCSG